MLSVLNKTRCKTLFPSPRKQRLVLISISTFANNNNKNSGHSVYFLHVRAKRKKKKKKETGNGDAHMLRRGIPGPKTHFLPCKVTETSLLYLWSGCCATQNQGLSQNVGSGLAEEFYFYFSLKNTDLEWSPLSSLHAWERRKNGPPLLPWSPWPRPRLCSHNCPCLACLSPESLRQMLTYQWGVKLVFAFLVPLLNLLKCWVVVKRSSKSSSVLRCNWKHHIVLLWGQSPTIQRQIKVWSFYAHLGIWTTPQCNTWENLLRFYLLFVFFFSPWCQGSNALNGIGGWDPLRDVSPYRDQGLHNPIRSTSKSQTRKRVSDYLSIFPLCLSRGHGSLYRSFRDICELLRQFLLAQRGTKGWDSLLHEKQEGRLARALLATNRH